ncbi:MAG: hypothetical protein JXR91_07105 [Deltaproteobacteria bacterium]|nr:hypothetical protein [Deltaproteobacteria bacterium]
MKKFKFIYLVLASFILTAACSDSKTVTKTCEPGFIPDSDGKSCVEVVANCEEGTPGSIVTECTSQNRKCIDIKEPAYCGNCLDGFKDLKGECVPVVTCEEIDCESNHMFCSEATAHKDAVCNECESGYENIDGVCAIPNCDAGAVASMVDACADENRTCDADDTGAACGSCIGGFVENEDGICKKGLTCDDLICKAYNRICSEGDENRDADCTLCMPGFEENYGVCEPIQGANCNDGEADSILKICDNANRYCMVTSSDASCGGCKSGLVEDILSGNCYEPGVCDETVCDAQNRVCSTDDTGLCAGCKKGYAEDPDTGKCRVTLKCSDIKCEDGQICVEAGDTTDALCRKDCGNSSIWNGRRCEPCPPCDSEGEVGRWPWPTASGNCICETEDNYFYSVSADMGPVKCDADSDGWVKESARIAITSKDPNVSTNARCTLKSIKQFKLINESLQTRVFSLEEPLELYESDRIDEDFILKAYWKSRGIDLYDNGLTDENKVVVDASMLNRLTKLCAHPLADYNDNGRADVDEYGDEDLAPVLRSEQKPFNEYSYFLELNSGWYEAPVGAKSYGTYVIAEKSRGTAPETPEFSKNPVKYAPDDSDYWRTCRVDRDAEWATASVPVGMDFATYDGDDSSVWAGMHHHSQFKCLVVDSTSGSGLPQKLSQTEIYNEGYRVNSCHLSTGTSFATYKNQNIPLFTCDYTSTSTLNAGDVVLSGVPYIYYNTWDGTDYVRGCVNECVDAYPECPGYSINPEATECVSDNDQFGKFVECQSYEVCDGFDNNFNALIDEGDPKGKPIDFRGDPCTNTNYSGDCQPGTKHCSNLADWQSECAPSKCNYGDGNWICVPNVQPGDHTETCNLEDDDCDGEVDEASPGVALTNGHCTPKTPTGDDKAGICKDGTWRCHNGSFACDQWYQPRNEECHPTAATPEDEDCDGQIDEPTMNSDGSCPAGWTVYYKDADGDGKGDNNTPGRCLCRKGEIQYFTVTVQGDCCDKDSSVPSDSYRTYSNKCGSFDWNCSGAEDKYWNSIGTNSGCSLDWGSCEGGSGGWSGSVAACGATAAYYDICEGHGLKCDRYTFQRTQKCR